MKTLIRMMVIVALLVSGSAVKIYAEETDLATQIYADENVEKDVIRLEFQDFSFASDKIATDSVIEYVNNDSMERYIVYDSKTGKVTDVYSVEYIGRENSGTRSTYTAFFTHDKNLGDAASIRFTACVTLYKEGSFRSFQALHYTNLALSNSVCSMYLDNSSYSAWSHTGSFPCTQLDYAYSTNVVVDIEVNAGVSATLIEAGFSHTDHYYRYLNDSGSFNLYQ